MPAIKERPIIFSTEMVRAILKGRKTQTRRVIKPQPNKIFWNNIVVEGYGGWTDEHGKPYRCPYGKVGDRLWVRESFAEVSIPDGTTARKIITVYKADNPQGVETPRRWQPSIHMPRWASRITLEITNIRVERLQDITIDDVIAEGFIPSSETYRATEGNIKQTILDWGNFWDALNGKKYPWSKNPWVWVIEFSRIKDNAEKK